MAAACIRNRKIVPTLASPIMHQWMATRTVVVSTQQRLANHCINGQHVRRPAGPEKSKCFVPRPRLYGTSLSPWWGTRRKSSHPTHDHNHDRAVDKAIKHCHELIKMEDDEFDQSIKIYPVRGAREYMGGVEMFHILLKTTGGQKYVAIYVAPQVHSHSYHEDEALKQLFFRKLDNNDDDDNICLPFRKVVGDYRWPVCPRNDPLITAAARFALAQHNKEEKLAHLIRATSQMVGENEIFRMTFKAEFSGGSSNYDAIVIVPRKNPEEMELVRFETSKGWQMYGRLMFSHGLRHIVPHTYPVTRYEYEDDDDEEEDEDEDEVKVEYEYEDDECLTDDPRVIAAARFALSQYNEKDQVRLDNKKDQVRRVVEATRRTYSGDEILNLRFDGELDGSWFYEAIVLVPVNDPENMRLAYCGRNWDDRDDDDDDEHEYGYERFDVYKYGFGECSIYDPRVTEAARFALALHNEKDKRKDKLLRVVKATSHINSEGMTWRLRFVGEDHPLRTYVAIVSVPVKEPQDMQVDYVLPEVHAP